VRELERRQLMVETTPKLNPPLGVKHTLLSLTRAPSTRAGVGLPIIVIVPIVVTLGILKPSFGFLFPGDPVARTVRHVLQLLLLLGTPLLVIWRMRLYEHPIRNAAFTRVVVGALVILFLTDALRGLLLTPLLSVLVADAGVAKTTADMMMMPGILFLYTYVFRLYEKREIRELSRQRLGKELGIGFACGILLPSLAFLLLYVAGYYTVVSVNQIAVLASALVSLTFISFQEELFFRGVLYRISEHELGTHLAVVISAAVFGAAHLTNENATLAGMLSATMGGALLGVFYSLTGRLWIPISFHLGWNLSQVFFGNNVSGVAEFGSFLEGRLHGPELLTGGPFGIVSSLPLLVGLSILIVVVYWQVARKGRLVHPPWERTPVET
jgi:membrane protease YdiL (CAAX protease family)